MTTIALQDTNTPELAFDGSRSFLVTRQHPELRQYEKLGVLTEIRDGWEFRYFSEVASTPGISPLPGLTATDAPIRSRNLFPLFAQRVLSTRRPDRSRIPASLGLDETATAFELLARNGGRRHGDFIELIQLPVPQGDGTERLRFLAHGMRHRSPEEQQMIDGIAQGDPLRIVPEVDDLVDPSALLITTDDGVRLGWVPAPLVPLLYRARGLSATVAHANGSRSNPCPRLLVNAEGSLIDAGHFTDPEWELVD
ncbi:hypothetical protein ACT3SP_00120 [Brachybacterium sp. AOP43-C2-M15]|uniref:hypothetical protein n=1 Tax=Brachybacterium sp. AOP43-C2-M15 TaxID=3457661 RepID=UPI0040336E5C